MMNAAQKERCIYFLRCGKYIKIGYSANVGERLKYHQATQLGEVQVIGIVEGTRAIEAGIHAELSEFKHRSEWYHDCDNVRDLVQRVLNNGTPVAIPDFLSIPVSKPIQVKRRTEPPAVSCQDPDVAILFSAQRRATSAFSELITDDVRAARQFEIDEHLPQGSRIALALGDVPYEKWFTAYKECKSAYDQLCKIFDCAALKILSDENISQYAISAVQLAEKMEGIVDALEMEANCQ